MLSDSEVIIIFTCTPYLLCHLQIELKYQKSNVSSDADYNNKAICIKQDGAKL